MTTAPRGSIAVHAHFHLPHSGLCRLGTDAATHESRRTQDLLDRCYRANAAARHNDDTGAIVDIANNYARIGWDVSPPLLDWIAEHSPWTYSRVVAGDAEGRRRNESGNAIAHPYVHAILPLASEHDRRTLLRWGIGHFRHHFGRTPRGMWLPEQAIDEPAAQALVTEGIEFTIISPQQVAQVRASGSAVFRPFEVVDALVPGRLSLPDGRSLLCWIQEPHLSTAVAFGDALLDGRTLGEALANQSLADHTMSVVADGETFGFHHPRGEMALAALIRAVDAEGSVFIGPHTALRPDPRYVSDLRIRSPSSRSCGHGVDRWRDDCGDAPPDNPTWNQAWRRPLRIALDGLSSHAAELLDDLGARLFDDPWAARDRYVEVLVDPSPGRRRRFLTDHGVRRSDTVRALTLLEIQRAALCSLDSGAWFGSDPTDPECVAALRHADRAVALAQDSFGVDLAASFFADLASLRGNRMDSTTADELWKRSIVPTRVDSAAVARTDVLNRAVGLPRVSDSDWSVHARSRARSRRGGRSAVAARFTVRNEWTGATETHALVALSDGHGRLGGSTLPVSDTDLEDIVKKVLRSGLDSVRDGMFFGASDLPPSAHRAIIRAQSRRLSTRGFEQLDLEAGVRLVRSLIGLGEPLPPALGTALGDRLGERLRHLLDEREIDERAVIHLLRDEAAVVPAARSRLAELIDEALGATIAPVGPELPDLRTIRRLSALARLAARAEGQHPSIWWVQTALLEWTRTTSLECQEQSTELARLARAVGVTLRRTER